MAQPQPGDEIPTWLTVTRLLFAMLLGAAVLGAGIAVDKPSIIGLGLLLVGYGLGVDFSRFARQFGERP